MKPLLALLLFIQIAPLGLWAADGAKPRLVLSRIRGALSSQNGESSKCEIYSDRPGINEQLKAIDEKILEISKIPISTSYHIMATVPSVEYWAYLPNAKGIEISSDYSELRQRKGKASEALIKLTDANCEK